MNTIKRLIEKQGLTPAEKVHLIYVDFKSAYDQVDWEFLFWRLGERDILNREEIGLLKFIYQGIRVGIKEELMPVGRGVPQGLALSPTLYNIATEDLIESLKSKNLRPFAFADDLLVVCKNEKELSLAITVTERWSSTNNYPINKSKSAVMRMNKKRLKKE